MTTTETGDDGDGPSEGEQRERLLPIDYRWLQYAFYAAIVVWSLYLLAETATWTRQEDYLVPYLVLSLLITLSVLRIVQLRFPIFEYVIEQFRAEPERDYGSFEEEDDEVLEAREKYEELTEGSETTPKEEKRLILGLAWILILPPVVYVLGFIVGFPLYVFSFSYYYLRDVKTSALVTAIFIASTYLLFIYLLKAPIYEGIVDFPIPI